MAKFRFSAGLKSTALLLLLVPLFLALGTWQLSRADEKRHIAQLYLERKTMAPMSLADANGFADKTNIPVMISGEYSGETYLLENQWRDSTLGVDVLSVFVLEDGRSVLLNRGWLENTDRRITPIIDTPQGLQTYQVTIYQPSKAPYTLGELALSTATWPKRISYLSIDDIALDTQRVLYPLTLRIEVGREGVYNTDWPVINVKPETHVGYAVQWFLFAVLAVLVYVFANSNLALVIRKKD